MSIFHITNCNRCRNEKVWTDKKTTFWYSCQNWSFFLLQNLVENFWLKLGADSYQVSMGRKLLCPMMMTNEKNLFANSFLFSAFSIKPKLSFNPNNILKVHLSIVFLMNFLIEYFWFLLFSLDEFDSYIIVSFVNATLVLSIGETVEEVTDSGFLGTTPTLSCSALGDDALVQV